jgi:hypothetical protein
LADFFQTASGNVRILLSLTNWVFGCLLSSHPQIIIDRILIFYTFLVTDRRLALSKNWVSSSFPYGPLLESLRIIRAHDI